MESLVYVEVEVIRKSMGNAVVELNKEVEIKKQQIINKIISDSVDSGKHFWTCNLFDLLFHRNRKVITWEQAEEKLKYNEDWFYYNINMLERFTHVNELVRACGIANGNDLLLTLSDACFVEKYYKEEE